MGLELGVAAPCLERRFVRRDGQMDRSTVGWTDGRTDGLNGAAKQWKLEGLKAAKNFEVEN